MDTPHQRWLEIPLAQRFRVRCGDRALGAYICELGVEYRILSSYGGGCLCAIITAHDLSIQEMLYRFLDDALEWDLIKTRPCGLQ